MPSCTKLCVILFSQACAACLCQRRFSSSDALVSEGFVSDNGDGIDSEKRLSKTRTYHLDSIAVVEGLAEDTSR
jgi:hypothetical protein